MTNEPSIIDCFSFRLAVVERLMPTTSFGLGGRKVGSFEFDDFLGGVSDFRRLDPMFFIYLGRNSSFRLIRRAQAWSGRIGGHFPAGVRLS